MTVGREYDGLLWLQGVASLVGIPVSQANFVTAQLLCIVLGSLYRKYLSHPSVPITSRHAFQVILGVPIVICVVGRDAFLLLAETVLCFFCITLCPPKIIHVGLFVFGMGWLILGHIYLMLFPFQTPCYDYTFSLLIATQKITSLGFNLADGYRHNNNLDLTDQRLRLAVRKRPGILELSSYILGFQGIVAGPFCFYQEYVDFIEGRHFSQQLASRKTDPDSIDKQRMPSPSVAVVKKVLSAFFWITIYVVLQPIFPVECHVDPAFVSKHSIAYRILHGFLSQFSQRAKYYVGWTLAEAVNNAAGFGFSGFDKDGKPCWDMLTNIYIKNIEMATSFKEYVDNWNLRTVVWLRFVSYDRAPWNATLLTFILSAVWHGLWPGYYVMFLSGALFTFAARKVRRNVRPYFQSSHLKCVMYDLVTWLATQLTITYIAFAFVLLHLEPIIFFYNQWYWIPHILSVLIVLLLPKVTSSRAERSSNTQGNTSVSEKNSTPLLDKPRSKEL